MLKMTQNEAANLIGISQSYVSQLAYGYYTTPSLGVARNLAEVFNDDLDDVWDLC
jgi:DNA-binding XRE family transcriptional regulator